MALFDPTPHWRNRRALEHARTVVLAHARRTLAQRRAAQAVHSVAMMDHHLGYSHLDSFRDQMPQILARLPERFRALELGAGMGWHACLTAAHSGGSVLATEVLWAEELPTRIENVHTLWRLAEREPKIRDVLTFRRDESGMHLASVAFDPRIAFVRAGAAELPVPDASLDLVYSFNVLEHIPHVGSTFGEAARALRVGGFYFGQTEMLFRSAFGHHLGDLFPLCWGHLLWPAEELADLVVREAGTDRTWSDGAPLSAAPLLDILRNDLNLATAEELRAGLRPGPWAVEGWIDLIDEGHHALLREARLPDALRGISMEDLLLIGVRILLRRTDTSPAGLRLPLRLDALTRRRLRRVLGR